MKRQTGAFERKVLGVETAESDSFVVARPLQDVVGKAEAAGCCGPRDPQDRSIATGGFRRTAPHDGAVCLVYFYICGILNLIKNYL